MSVSGEPVQYNTVQYSTVQYSTVQSQEYSQAARGNDTILVVLRCCASIRWENSSAESFDWQVVRVTRDPGWNSAAQSPDINNNC